MKKPLYYALRRSYNAFHVVSITSETARHWWGSGLDSGVGTHGKKSALVGRFETSSEAVLKVSNVDAIYAEHKGRIDAARNEEMRLLEVRRKAIAECLGVDPRAVY